MGLAALLAAKEDKECILIVVVVGRDVRITSCTTYLGVNHEGYGRGKLQCSEPALRLLSKSSFTPLEGAYCFPRAGP